MKSIEKVNEVLTKLNILQDQITSCEDDLKKIELQENLVNLLEQVFEDEDFLNILAMSKIENTETNE
jgi:phospholipid N-methyltransferase